MMIATLAFMTVGACAVDISAETNRHVVIAEGTEKQYNGHPTMTWTDAPDHLICVWTDGHAGPCGPAAESLDGGKTWTRIDERFPAAFREMINCPSIYRMKGPDGKMRLWVFAHAKKNRKIDEMMPRVVSEDFGKTWREVPPLGAKFRNIMTFASMVELKDGSYLALYHKGNVPEGQGGWQDKPPMTVWQSISKDGGFTWSDPTLAARDPSGGLWCCEPCVFRSPVGNELCCLIREQHKGDTSLVMFSRDEGRTWSEIQRTSIGLTGHRHAALLLPDGRVAVMMRNWHPFKGEDHRQGKFGAWVGPYESIKAGTDEGATVYKLIHSQPGGWGDWDCGYPAVALLPDGMIVAATYIKYFNDARQNSIVATRFNPMRHHIKAKIADCDRYAALNPHFAKAFAFLKRGDLASLKPGRYEIDGDNCWAMVQETKLTPFADGAKVEAHRKYIDIQSPLTGEETIGEMAMDEKLRALPFSAEKDVVLFDAPSRPVTLKPGEFAIYFPPDGAHAPGHCEGEARTIRKLVIKVRADGARN